MAESIFILDSVSSHTVLENKYKNRSCTSTLSPSAQYSKNRIKSRDPQTSFSKAEPSRNQPSQVMAKVVGRSTQETIKGLRSFADQNGEKTRPMEAWGNGRRNH